MTAHARRSSLRLVSAKTTPETPEYGARHTLTVVPNLVQTGRVNTPMTLTGYDDWMTERGFSEVTRTLRLVFSAGRLRDWGTLDVPAGQVVSWLARYHGHTQRTYYGHLNSVYTYLGERGDILKSPLAHLRRPEGPGPRPRPLAPRERDLVLRSAGQDPALEAAVHLAYLAGLRAHEIAKFRGEDITEDTLTVVGKGHKHAELPTNPDLWQLAQRLPREGYWFPAVYSDSRRPHLTSRTISTRVTRYFRDLGIPTGSVHRLRHTYATDLSQNGVPPRVIQALLRHTSLATTELYLEAASDQQRKAIHALSDLLPRGIAA